MSLAALENVEFRKFMLRHGNVGDLIPPLRSSNVLTPHDQDEIEKQSLNYRMIKLLDLLRIRLRSLDQLCEAMNEIPQTYELAVELLHAGTGMQVHSPTDQEVQIITELFQQFYRDYNQNFQPCYNQQRRTLDDVWVDVEVKSRNSVETDPPTAVGGEKMSDYQKCLPGQDRRSSSFNASRLVICLGEPGSGKTTLTRKIGVDWANQRLRDNYGLWQYDLVLVVILKNVANDAKEIWEMVVEYFASQERFKEQRDHMLRLKDLEGRLIRSHPEKIRKFDLCTLVVLDGYDEMKATCKELDRVLFNNIEDVPFGYDVLVTSRPYKLALCHIQHEVVKMRPFDKPHRIEFVKNYYPHGDVAQKLNVLIDDNAHLEKLSGNPLLLNFICIIYGIDKGSFTDTMTKCELYHKLFEHLIQQWKSKANDSHFDVQDWKNHPCIQAFAQLSFTHLLSTNQDYQINFKEEELERCMPKAENFFHSFRSYFKPKSHMDACKLLCEIGLIENEEQGTDRGGYSHWHTSFIEFGAALWLAVALKTNPLGAQMQKDEVALIGQTYRQLLQFYNPWKFVEVAEFLADMALHDECPREGAAKLISLVDPRVNVAAYFTQPFSLPLPLEVSLSMLHLLANERVFGFQAVFEYMCHKMDYKNLSLMKTLFRGESKGFCQNIQYFCFKPDGSLIEAEETGVSLLVCVQNERNIMPCMLPSSLLCDYCIVSTRSPCIEEFLEFANRFQIGHLHIQVDDGPLAEHVCDVDTTSFKLAEIATTSARNIAKEQCRVSFSFNKKSIGPLSICNLMGNICARLSQNIDELDIYGQDTVLSDLTQCLQLMMPKIVVLSDVSLPKEQWKTFVDWVSSKNLRRLTMNKCDIAIDGLHALAANSQHLKSLCLSRIAAFRHPKSMEQQNLTRFLEMSVQGHHLRNSDDCAQIVFCNDTLSQSQQKMANEFFTSNSISQSGTLVMFNNEWLPEEQQHNASVPHPDLRTSSKNQEDDAAKIGTEHNARITTEQKQNCIKFRDTFERLRVEVNRYESWTLDLEKRLNQIDGMYPIASVGKLREEAARKFNIDYNINNINIAVFGSSSIGKTSLINALRGVKYGDPDYCPRWSCEPRFVACPFPGLEKLVLWDVSGFLVKQADFFDQGLCIFNFLLVVSCHMTYFDLLISEKAKKCGVPFAVVRTRCDEFFDHMYSIALLRDNIGMIHHLVLTDIAAVKKEYNRLPELKDVEVFCVSSVAIEQINEGKQSEYVLDEAELMSYIYNQICSQRALH